MSRVLFLTLMLTLAGGAPAAAPDAPAEADDPKLTLEIRVDGAVNYRQGLSNGYCGERIEFSLVEGGAAKVTSRTWTVLPSGGSRAWKEYDRGKNADFVTGKPDTYVFFASIATADGRVAHAIHTLELTAPDAWKGKEFGPTPAPMSAVSRKRTVEDFVRASLGQVVSANKTAEARAVAGVMRAKVDDFEQGRLRPGSDLVSDIRSAANRSLGASEPAWRQFFDNVGSVFTELASRPIPTPGLDKPSAFRRIAAVLEQ
jgi:hypothetical protein